MANNPADADIALLLDQSRNPMSQWLHLRATVTAVGGAVYFPSCGRADEPQ